MLFYYLVYIELSLVQFDHSYSIRERMRIQLNPFPFKVHAYQYLSRCIESIIYVRSILMAKGDVHSIFLLWLKSADVFSES